MGINNSYFHDKNNSENNQNNNTYLHDNNIVFREHPFYADYAYAKKQFWTEIKKEKKKKYNKTFSYMHGYDAPVTYNQAHNYLKTKQPKYDANNMCWLDDDDELMISTLNVSTILQENNMDELRNIITMQRTTTPIHPAYLWYMFQKTGKIKKCEVDEFLSVGRMDNYTSSETSSFETSSENSSISSDKNTSSENSSIISSDKNTSSENSSIYTSSENSSMYTSSDTSTDNFTSSDTSTDNFTSSETSSNDNYNYRSYVTYHRL